MILNESITYLLGLIVGKGRLQETTMSIEFPCNNPYVYGVALCQSCSYPMTKPPRTDIYICKNDNCNKTIHKSDIENFGSIMASLSREENFLEKMGKLFWYWVLRVV